MDTLRITPLNGVNASFKEILRLLVEIDDLDTSLQAALGLEQVRRGDAGFISKGKPLPLDDDAEEKLCYFKVKINGNKVRDEGVVQSWRKDASNPNEYVFQLSVRMTVEEMRTCGINMAERTSVVLRGDAELNVWFMATTSSKRSNFDATIVRITDDSY